MTIEERAKEYAIREYEYEVNDHTAVFDADVHCCLCDYVQGATEQRRIDIENACKLFNNFIDTLVLTHPNKIKGDDLVKKQFKQAMEEQQ